MADNDIIKKFIESTAMDSATLFDWYVSSTSEDDTPVWTDEHIEELCNDFYLIPKSAVSELFEHEVKLDG